MEDFIVEPIQKDFKLPQFTNTFKILLIAAVIAVIGVVVFLFTRGSSFAERNVTVQITAPSEATTGDRIAYTVTYTNKNKIALTGARLVFYYPPEAVPLDGDNIKKNISESIDLGTIDGKNGGELAFSAVIVGHQGNVKNARAVLTFVPEGLATEIQKSAEFGTTIKAMPIALNVVVPPTVVGGQTVSYLVDYRNQTPEDFVNLRLHVKFPEGFVANDKKNTWDILKLPAGEGGRVTITGTISGREKEVKVLSASLQKQLGSTYVNFETAESSSIIASPLLSVAIIAQGSREYIAHVNDSLEYQVVVTNNTDADLTSMTLTVKLEGAMYELTSVDSVGFFDSRTRMVLWNSAVVPELGHLRAHSSVTVPMKIKLKPAFPGGSLTSGNSYVKAVARVETLNVPDTIPLDILTATDELVTRITTAATFEQRFDESAPPRVDTKSTITVHWKIVNPSNQITPAKVTAVLLPGMQWDDKSESTSGSVTYNSKTSTITWDLGSVAPGVGTTFPAAEASFQISFTPSVNQAQQPMIVLQEAKFFGTDVFTKEQLVLTVPNLRTSSVQP